VSSKEEVREERLDGLYGRPKNKKNPRLEILGYGYYFVHFVDDSKSKLLILFRFIKNNRNILY
jgi:hypothetical protein